MPDALRQLAWNALVENRSTQIGSYVITRSCPMGRAGLEGLTAFLRCLVDTASSMCSSGVPDGPLERTVSVGGESKIKRSWFPKKLEESGASPIRKSSKISN